MCILNHPAATGIERLILCRSCNELLCPVGGSVTPSKNCAVLIVPVKGIYSHVLIYCSITTTYTTDAVSASLPHMDFYIGVRWI